MLNILTEAFLSEYFSFDAVLGRFYNKKALFNSLSDIFCLPENEREELFRQTENPNVSEIVNEDDYKRFKRIRQYNEFVGNEQGYSESENVLISVKGNAVANVTKYGINATRESTETSIIKTLMSESQTGKIIAMRILGVLQCEGIVVDKDAASGVKLLKKAMRWGDICATLAMLKYSSTDKSEIKKMLNSAVKNTPYEFLPLVVEDKYGVSCEDAFSEEISLVKHAARVNKLKQDTYDFQHSRIIYSEVIGTKDKEKIIFSENRELISEACDLPLRLKYDDITINDSGIDEMPFDRKNEKNNIMRCLYGSDIRQADNFKPICLCSDSDYVLESYVSALKRVFQTANVERIDVGDLTELDFEATKNNVFIRCLNERKNNVYILSFKGDVSETAIELIKNVLRSDKRRKFLLRLPAVSIDLSSVLPVCVCDTENVKKIKNFVEIIDVEPIKTNEKPSVIKAIIEQKKSEYAVVDITISTDAIERLCDMKIESAERILDRVIRNNRKKSESLNVNMDVLKPYLNKKTNSGNAYGFGGVINEIK